MSCIYCLLNNCRTSCYRKVQCRPFETHTYVLIFWYCTASFFLLTLSYACPWNYFIDTCMEQYCTSEDASSLRFMDPGFVDIGLVKLSKSVQTTRPKDICTILLACQLGWAENARRHSLLIARASFGGGEFALS